MIDKTRKIEHLKDGEVIALLKDEFIFSGDQVVCPKCETKTGEEVNYCESCGSETERRTRFYVYYTSG